MKQAHTHDDAGEERDGFRFRGGHNAIDLPATLQGRLKPTPRELLATPRDLARWLVAARIAERLPKANDDDLALARALREAIYALASARVAGRRDAARARDVLNRVAALPSAIPRLSADDAMRLHGPVQALLATLAREAVRLFGGESAERIRQCQSPVCTLFFIDTSRAGDRRWCSMSGCGNKAKVAEFRRRQRQADIGA